MVAFTHTHTHEYAYKQKSVVFTKWIEIIFKGFTHKCINIWINEGLEVSLFVYFVWFYTPGFIYGYHWGVFQEGGVGKTVIKSTPRIFSYLLLFG